MHFDQARTFVLCTVTSMLYCHLLYIYNLFQSIINADVNLLSKIINCDNVLVELSWRWTFFDHLFAVHQVICIACGILLFHCLWQYTGSHQSLDVVPGPCVVPFSIQYLWQHLTASVCSAWWRNGPPAQQLLVRTSSPLVCVLIIISFLSL